MMRVSILAIAACLAAGAAEARKANVEVTPDNKRCYAIDYVPALYQVNSRGKLMRARGVRRDYAIVDQVGGTASFTTVPAVYMESRRLVEPDHYTMRPTACR